MPSKGIQANEIKHMYWNNSHQTALHLSTIRHRSAAATGCDLLPGGDGRPVHTGRAALGGTEVAIQQCWRVPGRRWGDQPQMAGADICHWSAAPLPVHAVTTPGENSISGFYIAAPHFYRAL